MCAGCSYGSRPGIERRWPKYTTGVGREARTLSDSQKYSLGRSASDTLGRKLSRDLWDCAGMT
jgi:hypothetical protein